MQEKELQEILSNEETRKGLITTFKERLAKMLSVFKSGGDVKTAALSLTQSEEERETLQELFEEIDAYYQHLRELQQETEKDPELTEEEWLETKLKESAKEVVHELAGREMTPEEEAHLMAEYDKALDKEIASEAQFIEKFTEIQSKEMLNDDQKEE